MVGDSLPDLQAWAESGAMWLTGRPDRPPLGPPTALVPGLRAFAEVIRRRSAELGAEVDVDPLQLLGERAALAGLSRGGQVSCGRATRLLRAADGWVAVSLARPDDVASIPAWLGVEPPPGDPWAAVAPSVAGRPVAVVVDRAVLLGMPVGALPAGAVDPPGPGELASLPVRASLLADGLPPATSLADVVVADLSSLWAGPLCAGLLAAAGAQVVKVESTTRPDGARRGPPAFFDLLNAGKRSVAVEFTTRELGEMVGQADVVIEASRPRALEQLGIDAAAGSARVWVSITGHGRAGANGLRVAFGDDAAVAGGLVSWNGGEPCFCADAIADPAGGLAAAAACLEALALGGSWLLDVSLAGVAASLAGPTLPVPPGLRAAPPRARTLRS